MAKKTRNKTIDGKVEVQNKNNGPTAPKSLAELLGRKEKNYGTLEEYENKLSKMMTTDLEIHATEVGVTPRSDRKTLISRLVNEYRKTSSSYFNTLQIDQIKPKNPDAILKALRGARS